MKPKSKVAIVGMIFAISISTVGVSLSTYHINANANANAYKIKAHKNNKKKTNKQPLKLQLNKDVNDYNQVVKHLDYPINANSNVEYTLISPYYSQNYSGMAKSMHAMAHDMSINQVDSYDGGISGVIATPSSLDELSNAGIQIYGMFSSRLKSKMSSSEFKKISNMRDTVQSNESKIDNYSNKNALHVSDTIIVTQWKNIQSLFNALGDNVSKLK